MPSVSIKIGCCVVLCILKLRVKGIVMGKQHGKGEIKTMLPAALVFVLRGHFKVPLERCTEQTKRGRIIP